MRPCDECRDAFVPRSEIVADWTNGAPKAALEERKNGSFMPIPKPRPNETFDAYSKRVIPVLIREGTPANQAAAIASSTWDQAKKKKGK